MDKINQVSVSARLFRLRSVGDIGERRGQTNYEIPNSTYIRYESNIMTLRCIWTLAPPVYVYTLI